MSLDPARTPVVVAVGQAESRDLVLGPLELAETAAREALAASTALAAAIERVTLVNVLSRRAGIAPASEVTEALGLGSVARETTSIGGNTPQAMVERAACDIAGGRLAATLIVGAEAVRSGRLKPAGAADGSGAAGSSQRLRAERAAPDAVVGEDRQDLSDEERMAGVFIPVHVYPMFESVLATRAGRTPAQQRDFIGRLMAPFTEVAAAHPHAWFRQVRSPEELARVSADNRLVAEPYLKTMVAFLGGAQAAALVVTSLAVAKSLKLDDGALFVWSAATANDVWFPMARPDLGSSVGLEVAANAALRAAGVGAEDMSAFDLYSCFPSAVQIAAASLGLDVNRPEETPPLTVTGGLPYFGGPGNNYCTHAIATMFEQFRSGGGEAGGRLGLVTGVGWYLTKHSVGVYGSAAPPQAYVPADTSTVQQRIDASSLACVAGGEEVAMAGCVEASTVLYDHDGRPTAAPVIATLEDGRRVVASGADGVAAEVAGTFLVGARIHVEGAAGATGAPTYRVVDGPSSLQHVESLPPPPTTL
ncbi:MAG: acetyl-CoA acetyltransferase [Acidimicrobiales bacterium]